MPDSLTIFFAEYLIFFEAALVAMVLAVLLYRRPRSAMVHWALTAILLLGLSYVLAWIGGSIYYDPRPFTVDQVQPLIPHAADNGFPSDHALLAAALVALVALVHRWLAVPIATLAVLVDGARVGAGLHHGIDVVGSTLFVALATLIALALTPPVIRRISPLTPHSLSERHRGL